VWNGNNTGTITRWFVGGGAGLVPYSGIDVHPTSTNLVYFSQPMDNMVGELNTSNGAIRRWNLGLATTLTTTPVLTPLQLDVDSAGLVWVVTRSGHLVRIDPLDPNGNNVVVADIPFLEANNPAAINADGTIGFTAQDLHKVGLLAPKLTNFSTVPPAAGAADPDSFPLGSTSSATITQFTGPALRFAKSAPASELPDLNGNGLFTEAFLELATPVDDCLQPIDPLLFPDHPCLVASTLPQGIAHDPAKAGAFYAAIGGSVLRVAHVTLLTGNAGGGATTGCGKVALTDPLTGLPAGTGSFSLWAYKTSHSQPAKGALNYTAPDGKVDSLQITGLTFSGNTATITGLCKTGSSCTTFQLKVTDGGWQASQDIFQIIKDPILGLGLEKGGNLANGGIKMYRWGQ
jgi:hypothetical protein